MLQKKAVVLFGSLCCDCYKHSHFFCIPTALGIYESIVLNIIFTAGPHAVADAVVWDRIFGIDTKLFYYFNQNRILKKGD